MRTLTAIVKKNRCGYSARLEEVEGIIAFGKSMHELRLGIMDAISVTLNACRNFDREIPEQLRGDFTIQYDTSRVEEWH